MPQATLGRSLQALIGNPTLSDFDSLILANPPEQYDNLLRYISHASVNFSHILDTPWTTRALSHNNYARNFHTNLTTKRKYKPVDQKVRPVPTYMPDPVSQQYKAIPIPKKHPLPIKPPPLEEFVPTERMTRERFDRLIATIPEGFLRPEEVALLGLVVSTREDAFAFTFEEKGYFKREYYPDYEIPVIEHTPWQRPPIRVPRAIEELVRSELHKQTKAVDSDRQLLLIDLHFIA